VPGRFEVALRQKFEFSGLYRELNDSVLTVSAQPAASGSVAYVELMLFGLADSQVESIETGWKTRLMQLFPD
jgi:hypothetical protein